MNRRFEAVIFDCDGVVVDSASLQVEAEQKTAASFADEHGLKYETESVDWREMAGWGRTKIAAKLFGVATESQLANEYRLEVAKKTVEIACPENTPLIPDVTQFVQYLVMRGLKLGLATSSNRMIYTAYCNQNGMDFFNPRLTVAHNECLNNKPKPDPFLEVMKRMDVEPDRTLVIEDSASGITAGRFAGATVLGLATTKSVEYLRNKTDAQLVATDFREAALQVQTRLPN